MHCAAALGLPDRRPLRQPEMRLRRPAARTVRFMAENGGGVLLYLDQEGRGNGIANKIRAYQLQSQGWDTYDADEMLGFGLDQRRFDFAAEMLKQLGVARVLDHDQQPLEDRCPAACRPRSGRGSARPWPSDGRKRAVSRLQARQGRPFHRSRRTRRAHSPSRTERVGAALRPLDAAGGHPGRRGDSGAGRSLGSLLPAWLVLAWPWLSGPCTRCRWDAKAHFQAQFQFLADSLHRGERRSGTLMSLRARRRSPIPRSLISPRPTSLLALLDPAPSVPAGGRHRTSPCCWAGLGWC